MTQTGDHMLARTCEATDDQQVKPPIHAGLRVAGTVARFVGAAALALGLCTGSALGADAPLWFDNARPRAQALHAVELLGTAASHGLSPQDYDAEALLQGVTLATSGMQEPATIARLEQALSAAIERFLTHVHSGRIDPRRIHHDFAVPYPEPFDAAATLRAALAAGRLREAVQEAAPRVPLYAQLREALAHYRGLAASSAGWHQALPALPGSTRGGGKLEPGQPYAGLALLEQRLTTLGDLAPIAPQSQQAPHAVPPTHYTGPLVDAVLAFQQRHGLAADGVIGKATLAQLQVTPTVRVRQIELALERLRWTPRLQARRMIVINIPEFVLRAYEIDNGRVSVRHEMKVIVGKAMDTRTPLFDETLRFIEFRPYWNVPASIARNELVPLLRRDPHHFEQQGFEFIGRDGRLSAAPLSPKSLDAVHAGELRLRQRPGPRNPLGDIKFVFPNREHIYLHHTPQTALFERERRDFSHGCIRVEEPVALAAFALQGMREWTQDRIARAMHDGKSFTLKLAEPVPVLIAYATTLVKGGRVHFFADLYGHDRLLDNWIRKHTPARRTIQP